MSTYDETTDDTEAPVVTNKYGDEASRNMPGCDHWWTCADCGTDYTTSYGGDGYCGYCYVMGTRYVVKLGNKVLYKGTNTDKAEAAYYGTPKAKWMRTEALINRPADEPYEG